MIKTLYAAKLDRSPWDHPLETDLFEKGESGYPSSLKPDQIKRIKVLLEGTQADWPGDSTPANRLRADAIELHELLSGDLDEAKIDRVMELQRRPKGEIQGIDNEYRTVYTAEFGVFLMAKLSGLSLARVSLLRAGKWPEADAWAIEGKRRKLVELAKSSLAMLSEDAARGERNKLAAEIEAILEQNRQEALKDPSNAGKSAAQAINDRLTAVLATITTKDQKALGGQLAESLGSTWVAAAVAPASDGADSGKQAARRLLEMEVSGTTSTEKIAELLRGLRAQARDEVMADPWVADWGMEAAIDEKVAPYIATFVKHYDLIKGTGRPYDVIVASARDEYNLRLLGALRKGGGEVKREEQRGLDVAALEVAVRSGNGDAVLAVLARQTTKADVVILENDYDEKHSAADHPERSLRHALFGLRASPEMASKLGRLFTGAALEGRNVALAEEALAPERPDVLGGLEEVEWLAKYGQRERQVTEDNSSAIGWARELGDDPETQVIMAESAKRLQELKAEWEGIDPWGSNVHRRSEILAEMRRVRATLTGDAAAYEAENEQIIDQIRSVASIAAQLALAYFLPGVGAGLMKYVLGTAMEIGASVASNAVIYSDRYNSKMLFDDVFLGVVGSYGGKLAEETLGVLAANVAARMKKPTAAAAEGFGVPTALTREAGAGVAAAETAAVQGAKKMTRLEMVFREIGSQAGSLGAITAVTEQNQFTFDALWQGLLGSAMGHAGQKRRDAKAEKEAKKAAATAPSTAAESPAQVGDDTSTVATPESDGGVGAVADVVKQMIQGGGAVEPVVSTGSAATPDSPPRSPSVRSEGAAPVAPEVQPSGPSRPPLAGEGAPTSTPSSPHDSSPPADLRPPSPGSEGQGGTVLLGTAAERLEARRILRLTEELASSWPHLDSEERLDALARINDRVLEARGVPPARFSEGQVGSGNLGEFNFQEWAVVLSPATLHAGQLPPHLVEGMSRLVRHEVEHTLQWWAMARLHASKGHDAAKIQSDMGIPLDVAEQAVAQVKRDGPLSTREQAAAQVWWDSVHGHGGSPREYNLQQREQYRQQLATLDAQIAAAGPNADSALLKARAEAQTLADGFDAMYRALPEEVRAYGVDARVGAEARLMGAERQADRAKIAAEQAGGVTRDIEAKLVEQLAAGRDPDAEQKAAHADAIETQQRLEDHADDLGAYRDAMAAGTTTAPGPTSPYPVPASTASPTPGGPDLVVTGPPARPKSSGGTHAPEDQVPGVEGVRGKDEATATSREDAPDAPSGQSAHDASRTPKELPPPGFDLSGSPTEAPRLLIWAKRFWRSRREPGTLRAAEAISKAEVRVEEAAER